MTIGREHKKSIILQSDLVNKRLPAALLQGPQAEYSDVANFLVAGKPKAIHWCDASVMSNLDVGCQILAHVKFWRMSNFDAVSQIFDVQYQISNVRRQYLTFSINF